MTDSFCRKITNAVRFVEHNGMIYIHPCCWTPKFGPVTGKTSLERKRQEARQTLLSDVEQHCRECLMRERTGYANSHRLAARDEIPETADDQQIYVLEFQIDTKCNAACTICGPQFSSLWRKQLNKSYEIRNVNHRAQQLLNMMDLSHVRLISFAGGEPFISDIHTEVLSAIPHPENVTISYISNGSIEPDAQLVEFWRKFKEVRLNFSIDGLGAVFEYIRWPLKWSKVEQNLFEYQKLAGNTNVRINHTVNPMNVFYFPEFEAWASEHKFRVITSACFETWATTGTPPTLRDLIKAQLGSEHRISRMLDNYPHDPQRTHGLVKNMDELDLVRGNSWRETFSEIAYHYDAIYK